MNSALIAALLLGTVLNAGFLVFIALRMRSSRTQADEVRGDLRIAREEARVAAKDSRDDIASGLRAIGDVVRDHGALQQGHFTGVASQLREFSEGHRAATEGVRNAIDSRLKDLQAGNEAELQKVGAVLELIRDSVEQKLKHAREELAAGLKVAADSSVAALDRMASAQAAQLDQMTRQLKELSETNQGSLEKIRGTLDVRVTELQAVNEKNFTAVGSSVSESLKLNSETLEKNLAAASAAQQTQLGAMTNQIAELSRENQASLERIRQNLDVSVKEMRNGNEQKLEEMRRTVDEKLHDTLEKRLGESFKLVGDRLDTVHRGLGEMQDLASGVGDLRRMLTNVKIRGTWGEVQLAAILTDMLAPDQWAKNVCVKEGSAERVECAIRLPGPKGDHSAGLWLPIDSKFPQEDYARLQAAADAADPSQVQVAQEALQRTIRVAAKDIHDKYINPPATTDFAILFLATEGLYAEVLREPGFMQELQSRYRVTVAGPATLAALLTSLRIGFQTLAIEQRANEVWRVLGAVKTEFGKFGGFLDKVRRQLQAASRTIEESGTRTRAMERKLRSVEQLDSSQSATILALPTGGAASIDVDEDLSNPEPTSAEESANDLAVELASTGTNAT